jgi:hypothetical protein
LQGILFVINQRCIGARRLEKCVGAAQREITVPILNIFHPQAQLGEMFKDLIRMLSPSGTCRGGEDAAVSDDADDEKRSHDHAERGLHFDSEWQLHFHLIP